MERPRMPVGYKFRPSDADLIGYLALYVAGKPVNSEVCIPEKDLYSIEPWHIIQKSEERVYFLTALNKKSPLNSRYIRRVGDARGTWKSQGKGKPVYRSGCFEGREQRVIIGLKKSLRYENKTVPEQDGQYLMQQYSLTDKIKSGLKGYVGVGWTTIRRSCR
ncbi:unnamed protein product [Cuscuta europaea]|uniref:NAC domain-containing protein n=1 Tax=Cuscuta europaea TaxID=41803 RepID=A0A9P1EJ08_CUSEU|nr:unnamed protein product [Cuscuta europaea]